MKKTIALASLVASLSTAFAGNITVIESEHYNNMHILKFNTIAKKSSKAFLMPETKARIDAIKDAEKQASDYIAQICTNGIENGYINHDTEECVVLDGEKNEVQCTVQTDVYCRNFSGIRSVSGLNLKLGKTAASTACLNLMNEKSFSVDKDLVNNCNEIKNEIQFECAEILTRYNSVKVFAIGKCGKFQNQHALNVLREYSEDGEDGHSFTQPSVDAINLFSKVDTQEEETCFKNEMRLSEISTSELARKCTNEVKETTQEVTEGARNIMDRIRGFFN